MADYFDNQAASDQQAKLDLLGQIAANGSQAAQAFQGAQTQIGQAKADALAQALSGARQRGAPQAEQDQIAATVGHQYDNTLGSLASQAANRASSFGQLSSAAGTYMDQAAAGLPTLRNALAQKVATLQAQARASEGQQQFQLESARITAQDQAANRDLERQRLQLELAKAQQPPDLGSIISQLGGQDLAGAQLSGALVGNGQVSRGVSGAQGGSLADQANRAASVGAPEDQFDPTRRLADATGIPAAAIGQLASGYQQSQGTAQRTADNQSYQDAQRAEQQRQDALTALSVSPQNYGRVSAKAKTADSGFGLKKGDNVSLFQFANDGYLQLMKQGKTIADANAEVERTLTQLFGHDYPQMRNYLAGIYSRYAKG